jgi:hypothetical protein
MKVYLDMAELMKGTEFLSPKGFDDILYKAGWYGKSYWDNSLFTRVYTTEKLPDNHSLYNMKWLELKENN